MIHVEFGTEQNVPEFVYMGITDTWRRLQSKQDSVQSRTLLTADMKQKHSSQYVYFNSLWSSSFPPPRHPPHPSPSEIIEETPNLSSFNIAVPNRNKKQPDYRLLGQHMYMTSDQTNMYILRCVWHQCELLCHLHEASWNYAERAQWSLLL